MVTGEMALSSFVYLNCKSSVKLPALKDGACGARAGQMNPREFQIGRWNRYVYVLKGGF
jgi:hypothetical protein